MNLSLINVVEQESIVKAHGIVVFDDEAVWQCGMVEDEVPAKQSSKVSKETSEPPGIRKGTARGKRRIELGNKKRRRTDIAKKSERLV